MVSRKAKFPSAQEMFNINLILVLAFLARPYFLFDEVGSAHAPLGFAIFYIASQQKQQFM
jgi:hypothetical protein